MVEPGRGVILAAAGSGAGKTTVTLALLRALAGAGYPVRSAKSGPDYIDPAFHAAASGRPCATLDAWAMAPDALRARIAGPGLVLIEGAMGLFDGAGLAGRGSTAELARTLDLPVILILDCARMAQSAAALVHGFATHDPALRVAGLILNRIGSPRHERMVRHALAPTRMPVLGAVPRDAALALPERHLGLVQAGEHPDLEQFLETAAERVAAHVDLAALTGLCGRLPATKAPCAPLPPLGQRIAVARDVVFAFAYPHLLEDWARAGATLHPFSPLAGEPPDPQADAVYLPGGYPELHAGELAAMRQVWDGVRRAAERGATVYGECGGYMVLGDALTDAAGTTHPMAGLLRLHTSFATRTLHLGYRRLQSDHSALAGRWSGHEFHYATTLNACGAPLFTATDADGAPLPPMGLRAGSVCGSFAHLIDRDPDALSTPPGPA